MKEEERVTQLMNEVSSLRSEITILKRNVKELQTLSGNTNIKLVYALKNLDHVTKMLRIEEDLTTKIIKILKLDIKKETK
jgi:hypothetical protein